MALRVDVNTYAMKCAVLFALGFQQETSPTGKPWWKHHSQGPLGILNSSKYSNLVFFDAEVRRLDLPTLARHLDMKFGSPGVVEGMTKLWTETIQLMAPDAPEHARPGEGERLFDLKEEGTADVE